MARLIILLLTLLALIFTTTIVESSDNYGGYPFPPFPWRYKRLHFYWHNKSAQPNQTAVSVTTSNSSSGFGSIVVFDDPLTIDPNKSSQLLGRSQGTYIMSDQTKYVALMAMTFVFVQGEFKGDTLALLGRNEILSKVREVPIVGGTGQFTFARGVCRMSTHYYNNSYTIVEYSCDVYYKSPFIKDI